MKIHPLLVFLSLLASTVNAGDLWRAMDLFEEGKRKESAVIFSKHCQKSPLAFVYCQHLAKEGMLAESKMDPYWGGHSLQRMKNILAVSLLVTEITEGKNNKKRLAINQLINRMQQKEGAAFFAVAKLFDDKDLAKALKSSEYKLFGKQSFYKMALAHFEFRSIPCIADSEQQLFWTKDISWYKQALKPAEEISDKFKNLLSEISAECREDISKLTLRNYANFADYAGVYGSLAAQIQRHSYAHKHQKDEMFWAYWAAQQGDPVAQLNLACYYMTGVPDFASNQSLAFKYAEASAAQNHPNALLSLADCYEQGKGVEVDLDRALSLSEAAYELGLVPAAFNKALQLKKKGQFLEACHWFKVALKHDDKRNCEFHIGTILVRTLDTENQREGLNYLKKAAMKNSNLAVFDAADFLLRYRDSLLFIEFHDWLFLAMSLIAQGDNADRPRALFYLGMLNEMGIGTEPDLKEALNLFLESAKVKYLEAMVYCGRIFEIGLFGKEPDLTLAKQFYQQAYDAGYKAITNNLGLLIYKQKSNDPLAAQLFEEALALNPQEPCAAHNLALMHLNRRGGLNDPERMEELFNIAIDQGNDGEAALWLGIYHLFSYCAQSLDKAIGYLGQAASLVHPYGKTFLHIAESIKSGRVNPEVFWKNEFTVYQRIFVKNDPPNDVFNFLIYETMALEQHASTLAEETSRAPEERKRLEKELELLENKKEVSMSGFNNLMLKIFEASNQEGHGCVGKPTASGYYFNNGEQKFGCHKPHKKKDSKLKNTAFKKGVSFLQESLGQLSDK